MNGRPSNVRVFGSSLVANPYSPQFRAYSYNGTDKIQPAKPVQKQSDPSLCEEPGCDSPVDRVRLCSLHYSRYKSALRKDPSIRREPTRRGFSDDACGTPRGYDRHRYWDVPLCDGCRVARTASDRERAAKKRKAAA